MPGTMPGTDLDAGHECRSRVLSLPPCYRDVMTDRHAATVRFTAEQAGWLRRRSFDLNMPQQLIIEDALVLLGMPRGDTARTGDKITTPPLPEGVKDLVDEDGNLWARDRTRAGGRWCRYVRQNGALVVDLSGVTERDMILKHGPLIVGKLRGQ
jgi:hypothetical protein